MVYKAINIEDSFECFDFCAQDLVDFLKESKSEILFFEHRDNSSSNVIVVVTKHK